ncbi:helix-turn-helix domain-containing protein [Rhizobium sp. SL86]|jgi:putative transcriptional regulator|uniref:helix-turn-helix domain-containing protein n=1 Tax=Rhizobium sp. SL86 TaxID=2995148 RepID=UPI00227253E7|nr:helix-turn-helix domain-containing protein [Rhizobium sp. SL86]MCY1668035.1 helix-turn-helix domain-containing protein [Rhizobium sp. SL86]
MKSSLRERFERLGPVEVVTPGQSGSRAVVTLHLDPAVAAIKSITVVRLLVENGMTMLTAKRAVEKAMETGQATFVVPGLRDAEAFAAIIADCGFTAKAVAARPVDITALRAELKLTQEQFALTYGIDVETLRNWEQGKRRPDRAAEAYLRVIERMPDAARVAQEDELRRLG